MTAGRPKKYGEDVRMQSIVLPDSIDEKLREIANKKGMSKNALIIATILKGLDAKDLELFIDEFLDNTKKKEIEKNPELEKKIIEIIKEKINVYFESGQIITKIREGTSKEEIINVFASNLIEPKVFTELDTQEIEYIKKEVSKKIISNLSKIIDEYAQKIFVSKTNN